MIRSSVVRAFPKPLSNYSPAAARPAFQSNILKAQLNSYTKARAAPAPLSKALVARRPFATSLARHAVKVPGGGKQDPNSEKTISASKLAADPGVVSTGSSVRHVTSEVGVEEAEPDIEMSASIKQDVKVIQDTFALKDVPKEALYMGMAGVLPYLATSLSTVYLAFDINHAADHGFGLLLDPKTAETLLHIIEPIQLGFGATMISFLGAIHWGLEWAGFGGHQGYNRYAIGVVATAVAWPTLLLPVEIGLIGQFLAFTLLYFTDAKASTIGWAPSWYATYRFVLTFVVGASIVLSLIGRGQIADKVAKAPSPADRMAALRAGQIEALEKEEEERRNRIAEEDEEEEGEQEEESSDDDDKE